MITKAKKRIYDREWNRKNYARNKVVHATYYLKNRVHVLARTKRNRDKYREMVLDTLGGKCVICGYSDYRALQIDHVNGGGKKEYRERNGRLLGFYNEVMADKMNRFQLLCANCNAIKRLENKEFGDRFKNYGQ